MRTPRRKNMTDDELREWFHTKVVVDANGCWIWQGGIGTQGYGRVGYAGATWNAQHLAYVLFVGDVPDGKQLNHKCNIKLCCNPEHIYAGTHHQNMRDRSRSVTGIYMRRPVMWTKLTENDNA